MQHRSSICKDDLQSVPIKSVHIDNLDIFAQALSEQRLLTCAKKRAFLGPVWDDEESYGAGNDC